MQKEGTSQSPALVFAEHDEFGKHRQPIAKKRRKPMSDKVDMPLSKGSGVEGKLGDLRTHYDKDKGEFHAHDDASKRVFRQADVVQFKLAIRALLSGPRHKEGTTVLFPGPISDPGNGRTPGNLLLTRGKTSWRSELVACGTVAADVVQAVDPVICDLYQAVYGNTDKIGDLRFGKDLKNDEVTISSDYASFAVRRSATRPPTQAGGIRRFELAIDGFLSSIGQYRENVSVLMPGDKDSSDLVIQLAFGHWSAGLSAKGGFQADVVIGDEVLNDLDEIAQL